MRLCRTLQVQTVLELPAQPCLYIAPFPVSRLDSGCRSYTIGLLKGKLNFHFTFKLFFSVPPPTPMCVFVKVLKCSHQNSKMLLSAFKIGQNSHPANCLGKSYSFAIMWYLSNLFVIFFKHLLILKKLMWPFSGESETCIF